MIISEMVIALPLRNSGLEGLKLEMELECLLLL